jgi:hypothetical protein
MRSKAKGAEKIPRQTNYLLQIKFRFWNGFPISDSVNLQWEKKKCKPKIKGGFWIAKHSQLRFQMIKAQQKGLAGGGASSSSST